jgi:galactokinase
MANTLPAYAPNEFLEDPSGFRRFFAPGRVNLIGEHLDYNGGRVMPAAINRGIFAWVRPLNERVWRLRSSAPVAKAGKPVEDTLVRSVRVSLDPVPGPGELAGWGNHAAGVLALLQERGLVLPGLDIWLYSDLPEGAGLSSSAAFEMLLAWIAHTYVGIDPDLTAMALLSQQVEARYLGVQCGIMDPYAVGHGRQGMAMLLDCSRLEHECVPAQIDDYQWIILNSNKARTLAGSAYNERRKACEGAAAHLGLRQLAELKDPEKIRLLPDTAWQRAARHVYSEVQRVSQAAEALRRQDPVWLGQILNASHASLRDDYAVSCREMDVLVGAAQHYPGCAGARMTGAGFGGCAVALVQNGVLGGLIQAVRTDYEKQTGLIADVFPVDWVGGVGELT